MFFVKQKTAYEMGISDWSSDVCSSDLKMVWLGGATRREYVAAVKTDALAQALVGQIQPFIKNDDPAGAEALLATGEAGLTPEGLTEVRQRVAWAYYIESDDANARRMAEIGRAHVRTPVTNAHLVCRLLLEKKKHSK